MIPTIGVMIGVYCCLRCLELLCSASTRYWSPGAAALVRVVAALVGLVIAGSTLVLMESNSSTALPKP